MQRITKFSALIGFLAVMAFVIGAFMYMPTISKEGASLSPAAAMAFFDGSANDGGCCGGGGGGGDRDGGGGGNPPPPPAKPACTLNAAPMSINQGQSSTLTWTTSRATSVVINQGVGSVTLNGNTVVSPTQTITYTLTATGRGGTVHCAKTITVVPPETPNPVCTLDAAPTTITNGQSAQLSWTTHNASSVSINQGIGAKTPNVAGNQSVSPTQTTTYTLSATGNGKTVHCYKTVTVTIPTPDPYCTLDAAPTTITNGQSATLSWTMQNATAASIDQGVGNVSLNVSGSKSVSPTQTTTYTLSVSGNGKTVMCPKTVTVNPVVVGLTCAISASPSSFGVGGGTTNLSWNTTGASSASIDQGIGGVSLNSSQSVSVGSSKTFILTAVNGQGQQVQCQTSVSVDTDQGCTSNCGGGGGGGTSRPTCSAFRVSDKDIKSGERVTLSWKTKKGEELTIKDNHGDEIFDTDDEDEVDDGSIGVNPKKDVTYTLKVTGKNNKTDSCTVKVNVDNDDFKVTTVRDRQPVTTITFRDVPYTGFDAGPTLFALFYTLLALWALVASYIIVVKRGSVMGFSLATVGFAPKASLEYALPVVTRVATPVAAPFNLPVAEDDEETEEEEVIEEDDMANNDEENATLENRAFAAGMILSKDALLAVKNAGNDVAERVTILNAIIARAKESFPREDGWIALDRARIQALFN